MSNQPSPQVMNPGEGQMPPYGQVPSGNNGGQFPAPPHHPGMMQMGQGGMPYPPYMMFPMGGPFYMSQMDMPPDMHHFQGPMMQMPFGYHPMAPMHMNPNVAHFVPANKPPAPVSESGGKSSPAVSEEKAVSRRLPIIDPVTGEEISIKPVAKSTTSTASVPASALISADVAFGINIPPTRPEKDVKKQPAKLKNAPLVVKPKVPETPEIAETVEEAPAEVAVPQRKTLKGIKNAPLVRRETTVITPPLAASSSGRFKLTNKPLVTSSAPTPSTSSGLPIIPREVFLQYLSVSRPDRNAPSSINVFPSELLGLKTALHGDPGLSALRARRTISGGLQKTSSQVSVWRGSGKTGNRVLAARQTTSGNRTGGGRSNYHPHQVNQIIRPSERGFKVIDQSSLSEKDKLRRQVMSQLNKITVDSFGQITNQIAEIEIAQPWQMDVVIGLIFDKAVVEHSYSEMYAGMCKKLRTTWPELTGVDMETGQSVPVTFQRAIIEKCQVEFDNMPDSLEPTEADHLKVKGNLEDLEMLLQKRKERVLGNMKFIAQLYIMGILSSRVIRSVVEQLLFRVDAPEEHYIECVGILFHNIGSTLTESEGGRAYIVEFVDRMHELSAREEYGKRIKFLMKDIIDAAKAGWAGNHAGSRLVSAAKSKEEVRRDAQIESEKKKSVSLRGGRGPAVQFRPTAVLKRASDPAPKAEEWSDEDREEEASEYAASQHDEEEGAFTTVARH